LKEKRKRLHRSIRLGDQDQVKGMLQERDNECIMLAMAKDERSRCSLHIAVLSQNKDIVRFLADNFPATIDVIDNVSQYIVFLKLNMIKQFFKSKIHFS